jgi:hypothetical protein
MDLQDVGWGHGIVFFWLRIGTRGGLLRRVVESLVCVK